MFEPRSLILTIFGEDSSSSSRSSLKPSLTTKFGDHNKTSLPMNLHSHPSDETLGLTDANHKIDSLPGTVCPNKMFPPSEISCPDDETSLSSEKSSACSLASREAVDSSFDSTASLFIGGDKISDSSECSRKSLNFNSLRVTYLLVTLVIMLADGLQGTHLYVLYEGYGFSVASLYCLGFVTGGLASPLTGALVDKLGRKKSAILYCVLEIAINMLEQYPVLPGLIISRMVGGVTTNLLSTVFDTWLDTEYRRRGLDKDGYEIIMRDSVIVSNLAAIGSGYLAHMLAETYGPVGPFEGAVTCTTIALVVVVFAFSENYGSSQHDVKGMAEFMKDAVSALRADKKVLKVGVVQGFTCASIQIFIFLWSPALRHFSQHARKGSWGLDAAGEPAYGLIFGAFMAAGVIGGLLAPSLRKLVTYLFASTSIQNEVMVDGNESVRPCAVELLATSCYFLAAVLLMFPCLLPESHADSFSICLMSFLAYELLVGLYLPCEGVLRSLYFPSEGRASILTLPRIIVNFFVSLGVFSTNFISMKSAFSFIVVLMIVSGFIQMSLISGVTWASVVDHFTSWIPKSSVSSTSPESSPIKMTSLSKGRYQESSRKESLGLNSSTVSVQLDKKEN